MDARTSRTQNAFPIRVSHRIAVPYGNYATVQRRKQGLARRVSVRKDKTIWQGITMQNALPRVPPRQNAPRDLDVPKSCRDLPVDVLGPRSYRSFTTGLNGTAHVSHHVRDAPCLTKERDVSRCRHPSFLMSRSPRRSQPHGPLTLRVE